MIACPKCGAKMLATETRTVVSGARRRRICESIACGTRVTTLEVIVPDRTRFNERMVLVDQRRVIARLHELESELTP